MKKQKKHKINYKDDEYLSYSSIPVAAKPTVIAKEFKLMENNEEKIHSEPEKIVYYLKMFWLLLQIREKDQLKPDSYHSARKFFPKALTLIDEEIKKSAAGSTTHKNLLKYKIILILRFSQSLRLVQPYQHNEDYDILCVAKKIIQEDQKEFKEAQKLVDEKFVYADQVRQESQPISSLTETAGPITFSGQTDLKKITVEPFSLALPEKKTTGTHPFPLQLDKLIESIQDIQCNYFLQDQYKTHKGDTEYHSKVLELLKSVEKDFYIDFAEFKQIITDYYHDHIFLEKLLCCQLFYLQYVNLQNVAIDPFIKLLEATISGLLFHPKVNRIQIQLWLDCYRFNYSGSMEKETAIASLLSNFRKDLNLPEPFLNVPMLTKIYNEELSPADILSDIEISKEIKITRELQSTALKEFSIKDLVLAPVDPVALLLSKTYTNMDEYPEPFVNVNPFDPYRFSNYKIHLDQWLIKNTEERLTGKIPKDDFTTEFLISEAYMSLGCFSTAVEILETIQKQILTIKGGLQVKGSEICKRTNYSILFLICNIRIISCMLCQSKFFSGSKLLEASEVLLLNHKNIFNIIDQQLPQLVSLLKKFPNNVYLLRNKAWLTNFKLHCYPLTQMITSVAISMKFIPHDISPVSQQADLQESSWDIEPPKQEKKLVSKKKTRKAKFASVDKLKTEIESIEFKQPEEKKPEEVSMALPPSIMTVSQPADLQAPKKTTKKTSKKPAKHNSIVAIIPNKKPGEDLQKPKKFEVKKLSKEHKHVRFSEEATQSSQPDSFEITILPAPAILEVKQILKNPNRPKTSEMPLQSGETVTPKMSQTRNNEQKLYNPHYSIPRTTKYRNSESKNWRIQNQDNWKILQNLSDKISNNIKHYLTPQILPYIVRSFMFSLNNYCLQSKMLPAHLKGGFVRRLLLGIIKHGYPLLAADYDFNINRPEPAQYPQFESLLKSFHAKLGKRKGLYTITSIDQSRIIYIDLCINRESRTITDFICNSIKFSADFNQNKQIEKVYLSYNTDFFDSEEEVIAHFMEQKLLTPRFTNPRAHFFNGWNRMLRGARFACIENWILPENVKEQMLLLGDLLKFRKETIITEKNYKIFIGIANELGKMTGMELYFQIRLLELFKDLKWLTKIFPTKFQDIWLEDDKILFRLKATLLANPHLNLQTLYHLHYAGCGVFVNSSKKSSQISILDDKILKNNLSLMTMLFRMSDEYSLILPEEKTLKHLISENKSCADNAGFESNWNMVVDNLSAIFLRHSTSVAEKFNYFYQLGFLTRFFPNMEMSVNAREFIRTQLISYDSLTADMKWSSVLCVFLATVLTGMKLSAKHDSPQLREEISQHHNDRYRFLILGLDHYQFQFLLSFIQQIKNAVAKKPGAPAPSQVNPTPVMPDSPATLNTSQFNLWSNICRSTHDSGVKTFQSR